MGHGIVITGEAGTALQLERTCRRIGLDVAAYAETSLRPDAAKVVACARELGASGVHPGRVAPQVRAELARATKEAGLLFVGPTVSEPDLFEDKIALRAAAEAAGIRVPAGSEGAVEDATALAEAERIGYPMVVKPIAGTSAVGVRVVDDPEDIRAAVAWCRAEAAALLGDDRVYFERAIPETRQLEVVVAVDSAGSATTLTEQETSLQSNWHPMVIESPSPLLLSRGDGEAMREALWDAALRLAEAMGLRGGMATFEFLLDAEARVYLTDCNANACRSSLAAELTTRIVPIELEIDLARGEPLGDPLRLAASGHGIEMTVRAAAGNAGATIEHLRFPPVAHGKARIEAFIDPGGVLAELPEPPVARVAAFAQVRHLALLALDRILAGTETAPVQSNIAALRAMLGHESFRAGQYHAGFADGPLRTTRTS